MLCKCHTFFEFQVELVASVIETAENFFYPKEYGVSRKDMLLFDSVLYCYLEE